MRRPSSSPLQVCITVDLEPDCPPYLWTWRGLIEGAPKLLDLFARHQIPATYFVTGDTADRHPEAVQALVAAGHELACHGMTHRSFMDLDRQDASWEILESARRLREFGPVNAFRAPYLQFPDEYLGLLEAAGFSIDSSQAKYKRSYYRSSAQTALTRIPASMTSSVLRLPAWLRDKWLLALRSPVVLFVHPWEFVDLTRERLRIDCRFRTGGPALRDLSAVIALFQSHGATFSTVSNLVQFSSGAELRQH